MPESTQLTNFLQRFKKQNYGPSFMAIGDFDSWCLQRSALPSASEPDTPFVVRQTFGLNADPNASIRVFISTRRLLELSLKSDILHADATYKLNWEGLPTMVVGTTDQDRHFHAFGLGITSGETAEDFAFIFQSVADGVRMVTGANYQPSILVADAADAITNGFASVFGQGFKRIMCWAHAKRAMDKRLAKVTDEEKRDRIMDDIYILQLCSSEAIFDAVIPLFFEKWWRHGDPDMDSFLHYFQREWISGHKNWFEGYAMNRPSTNNALESTNNRIKRDSTLRNRLALPQFLDLAANVVVRNWSLERNPETSGCKNFALTPTKKTKDWTAGFQWESQAKHIPWKHRGAWTDYFIPANEQTALTPPVMDNYRRAFANLSWTTFEEYALMWGQLWVVSILNGQWEYAKCNCPPFLKKYKCKHVIGVGIRKGLCSAPEVAKGVPIGQKRKRGRPPKASAALVVD